MALLSVKQISSKELNGFALKEISFTQQRGQRVAIAGVTGSGKSTLLKIIGGIIQPGAGEVIFENKKVTGPDEKLFPGHLGIAYLSQYFELRNNYRVEEELSYTNQLPEKEAETIFEVCRISHLLKRKTNQLSGGERQRIVLARLLISMPRLLLLDEPFSNLDAVHKQIIKSVIHDIGALLNISCILIAHDPLDVLSWADEILVMQDGQMIQKGSPQQIYQQPVNEYTAGLFGGYNLISKAQAEALGVLSVDYKNGKPLLVRPEQVKIETNQDFGVKVNVRQTRFFGSYYETEVDLLNKTIIAKTNTCDWLAGDEVFLSIPANALWTVDA